jgi:hypothetical protein
MDGFEKMSRDELRSVASKLKVMKYSDIQKLRKNELINAIKCKEIFPFGESFFDDKTVVRKENKKLKSYKPITHQNCPICLDNVLKDGKLILECNHYFHGGCIFDWLKENNTCPMCRQLIRLTKTPYAWIIDKSVREKIIITFTNN